MIACPDALLDKITNDVCFATIRNIDRVALGTVLAGDAVVRDGVFVCPSLQEMSNVCVVRVVVLEGQRANVVDVEVVRVTIAAHDAVVVEF